MSLGYARAGLAPGVLVGPSMTHSTSLPHLSFALVASLAGCAIDTSADDGELIFDDKADSSRSPTLHGPLAFTVPMLVELSAREQFHAWELTLTGAADVLVATAEGDPARPLDTIVYLYRRQASGAWGRYIARNDDATDPDGAPTAYAQLSKEGLAAGHYRVLVKAKDRDDRGPVGVFAECDGAGCPPDAVSRWLADAIGSLGAAPASSHPTFGSSLHPRDPRALPEWIREASDEACAEARDEHAFARCNVSARGFAIMRSRVTLAYAIGLDVTHDAAPDAWLYTDVAGDTLAIHGLD